MNLRNKYLILALFAGLALTCRAQVDCSLAVTSPAPLKAGDKVTAKLTVDIGSGWHIYSLTTPEGGPYRSEIELVKGQPFKLAGKIGSPAPAVEHSEAFRVDVESYQGEVVFTIPLEATAAISPGTKLVVNFTYQACTDENCDMPVTTKAEAVLSGPSTTK